MIESATIAKESGNCSACDVVRASIAVVTSFGLPLAQLLLLSCP
ncbi:MAG TPA: hypothetical protein VL971_06325 [Rhizomicrobium sp.]|nr:hypothetical protein [Rhizomicrobium sp.]